MESPMFVYVSENTSLASLVLTSSYSKKTDMADCCFSLRAVIMLLEQRASQMGGDFSLRWRVRRENLGSLVLRDCLWFMGIKKNECVDFCYYRLVIFTQLHNILHAIVMCISSVKTVLWLAVNLHHLFSNGGAVNTQTHISLTSNAISRSLSHAIHLRFWA